MSAVGRPGVIVEEALGGGARLVAAAEADERLDADDVPFLRERPRLVEDGVLLHERQRALRRVSQGFLRAAK